MLWEDSLPSSPPTCSEFTSLYHLLFLSLSLSQSLGSEQVIFATVSCLNGLTAGRGGAGGILQQQGTENKHAVESGSSQVAACRDTFTVTGSQGLMGGRRVAHSLKVNIWVRHPVLFSCERVFSLSQQDRTKACQKHLAQSVLRVDRVCVWGGFYCRHPFGAGNTPVTELELTQGCRSHQNLLRNSVPQSGHI